MAEGYVWPPRQQPAVGTADPGELAIAPLGPLGTPLTLSNAVPWVRSEKDTFLSSQFLVSAGRRGDSN